MASRQSKRKKEGPLPGAKKRGGKEHGLSQSVAPEIEGEKKEESEGLAFAGEKRERAQVPKTS